MAMPIAIQGYCDPRFSKVKEAFQKNFDSGLEVGASVAVTVDGKFVVDLWGGYADAARTRPWKQDTIANVYSTTKVMTALCALMLIDRGQLDLDAPVARYWPEFAQNGKEKMPVRYLLSHQAGLAGFEAAITDDTLYDWGRATSLLAAQKPWWEPGTASGYHGITMGYLVGEVVRRITGKTLGTFFREEVAIPLNADFYIGLPEKYDRRVAELIPAPALKPGDPGYAAPDPDSIRGRSMKSLNPNQANETAWRRAEIPAANGHGNAHSVARVGAALACGGELDGVRLLKLATIEKALEEQCDGTDLVLGDHIRWGLGVELNIKERPHSPNPRTFSWGGAGGSIIVVDLDAKLSWSYVMNRCSQGAHFKDQRNRAIAQALNAIMY